MLGEVGVPGTGLAARAVEQVTERLDRRSDRQEVEAALTVARRHVLGGEWDPLSSVCNEHCYLLFLLRRLTRASAAANRAESRRSRPLHVRLGISPYSVY